MTWLIITILLCIAGGIAGIIGFMGRSLKYHDPPDPDAGTWIGWGFGLAALFALGEIILTIASGINIVPAGHVGIVYGFGGGSIVSHLDSGTAFIAPWREVKIASAQVQVAEFDFTGDRSAVSIEAQPVYAILKVNYQIAAGDVVTLYRNVGTNWFHILMEGRAAQDFKEITSKYHTVEVTPHREQIREATRDAMRRELAPYSIHIVDVQIFNVGFPKAFTQAIEDKQVATQRALAAQAKVAQAKYEADQVAATASGDARATLVRAQAQAQANRLLSQSLTPNIIAYTYVQKLAPTVGTIVLPSSSASILPSSIFGSATSKP